jgi:serine O-acetyltransferase
MASMSRHRDNGPGLIETLLADVEWTGGPVDVGDDTDPEGWRARGLDPARLAACLPRLGFHATVLYRLARWLRLRGLTPLSYGLTLVNQLVTGAELSHNADIGPGLRVLHPAGVYVAPGARVGFRATFNQSSAVQKGPAPGSAEPVCGNYLVLGPGAKVVGKVVVGDRVTVGPNSAAMDDVPDDATVLGVPARPLPPGTTMR